MTLIRRAWHWCRGGHPEADVVTDFTVGGWHCRCGVVLGRSVVAKDGKVRARAGWPTRRS